jgi:hypothetical protein
MSVTFFARAAVAFGPDRLLGRLGGLRILLRLDLLQHGLVIGL